MKKAFLFFLAAVSVCLMSCFPIDGDGIDVDYGNAEPVYFDVLIINNSNLEKEVIFEREQLKKYNETWIVYPNSKVTAKNLACYDIKFGERFLDERGMQFGDLIINIHIADEVKVLGDFYVEVAEEYPVSYGKFYSKDGIYNGFESGTIPVKITINEDESFTVQCLPQGE